MDLSIMKAASLALASGAPVTPQVSSLIEVKVKEPEPWIPEVKVNSMTPEQCIALFGEHEAVLMNFIPQMLTAIALDEAEKYIKYCSAHRLEQFKRHNRQMRRCIEEYNRSLRDSYRHAYMSYRHYCDRLRQRVAPDLFKAWCVYSNEANRQYKGCLHNEIPARLTFVRMLLTFIEDFDREWDKVISSRTGRPCQRREDPQIVMISVLCIDLAERFGGRMRINSNMTLCVKVLVQRCRVLVNEIIAEENKPEKP